MRLSTSLVPVLATAAIAHPNSFKRQEPQLVHLTFHGGPAQYTIPAFPPDGTLHQTNNDIAVNVIDAPDYNAIYQCEFVTDGEKALVTNISPNGTQQILVGPPQPIRAVRCSGMCVATYSDCYDRNGQYVGPCCAGYCAANKCRPWVNPTAPGS